MASVADRWWAIDKATGERTKTPRYGRGLRWQVRYRDLEGASRNRSFERKVDADRFAVELQRQLNRGEYIDVNAGRTRFSDYAVTWMERQIVAPTTREAMDVRLRVHLLPEWSAWELRQIRPADIQGWLRRLSDELAPRYVQLLLTNFGAILQGASDDGLIPRNPARSASVRLPSHPTRAVRPWTPEQVLGMVDAVPERFRALVAVAAGCGLRQGEAFGIRVHDIDWGAETLHVRQQIRLEAGKPVPALPKYQRVRSVPVGVWVLEHLEGACQDFCVSDRSLVVGFSYR